MNTQNAMRQAIDQLDSLLQNLESESGKRKESLVDVAFSYVLGEPDVPDHVKCNLKCIRQMYIIADAVGERKGLS